MSDLLSDCAISLTVTDNARMEDQKYKLSYENSDIDNMIDTTDLACSKRENRNIKQNSETPFSTDSCNVNKAMEDEYPNITCGVGDLLRNERLTSNANLLTENKGQDRLTYPAKFSDCKSHDPNKEAGSVLFTNNATRNNKLKEPIDFLYRHEDKLPDLKSNETGKKLQKDSDDDTICGIGSFKPQWLQNWATSKIFLILFSIVGILQGSNYTYFSGIRSTVEKRFGLNSKLSGTIVMIEESAPLFFGVLIGYFGGKGHRPRLIATGMLMAITCSFLSALPFFVYGPEASIDPHATKNASEYELCENRIRDEDCNEDERPPTVPVVLIFLLGGFLKGFGSIAYNTVGIAYMDDNTKKENTSIYLGLTIAFRVLGPLTGFLLSSLFLKFPENPFDYPEFGPDDPRCIGGWWMGYILIGLLLSFFTFPLALFPRRLPSDRRPKSHANISEKKGMPSKIKGLFTALKRLAKNPLYILLVVNTLMMIYGTVGHYSMLPKYMESQFRLTASDASLYSGPPGLAAIMVAVVFGGFIIWKFKPSVKKLIIGLMITEAITAAGYLLLMIPSCGKIQMSHFGTDNEGLILASECNANCSCSVSQFTPVCGFDGKTTYFSPCFAGCSQVQDPSSNSNKRMYENCSCLTGVSTEENYSVTEGHCPVDGCWSKAIIYIVAWPIVQVTRSLFTVASTMIMLRSIAPEDKSVALGTFEALVCPLGFMPFSVIFGAIVDSACVVWKKSCGQTGSCWVYDMDKFNYLMHGVSGFFTILSAMSFIGIYYFNNWVRNLYDDDDDDFEDSPSKKANETLKPEPTLNSVTKL